MVCRELILHVAFAVGTVVMILVCVWYKCCRKSKRYKTAGLERLDSKVSPNQLQLIASLHTQATANDSTKWRSGLNGFRRSGGNKPLFSWDDHPSFTKDAVESGWARFAFTLSPSVRPTSLLGACATGESSFSSGALNIEISWEIGYGANDFMQKIRFNPGMIGFGSISSSSSNSYNSVSVIRTALPLPGPVCAFPQDAYFEIEILACRDEEDAKVIKIMENGSVHMSSASNISATSGGGGDGGGLLVAVGLTVGGVLPMKIPGNYSGSIGLMSNGSIHHDGNKLVWESEKRNWGMLTGTVIGCGFVPSQKTVFFTKDSELAHTIYCTTEEFGTPLYPTLAANCDVTLLVNYGQSPFKYVRANATRTPNPCFVGSSSGATITEDSMELFSMGRIDSQWHNRIAARDSIYAGHGNPRDKDLDEESDMEELFEIVLEGNRDSSSVGR